MKDLCAAMLTDLWGIQSDVTRFLTLGVSNKNDRPGQRLCTLKHSQLFIEFCFSFLNNLKSVERRK
jgi:hypothetical protein